MTQPTQAQVQAIGEAMAAIALLMDEEATPEERANAIRIGEEFLSKYRTAAAQVGRKTMSDPQELEQCEPNRSSIIAAQVGEPTESERWRAVANQGIHIETQLRKELLTIELATIERCAQVAESKFELDGKYYGEAIAAAIRKLKDEHAST